MDYLIKSIELNKWWNNIFGSADVSSSFLCVVVASRRNIIVLYLSTKCVRIPGANHKIMFRRHHLQAPLLVNKSEIVVVPARLQAVQNHGVYLWDTIYFEKFHHLCRKTTYVLKIILVHKIVLGKGKWVTKKSFNQSLKKDYLSLWISK